jgi:endonuclease/exonuclease/phosphatase family metal-dependent hydrolase
MNTHLSLLKDVREYQVRELLGEEWLNAIKKDERVILMGDLNLGSNSRAYQWLLSALSDAQVDSGLKKPQKTFPSSSPLRNIDHIFYRGQMCPVHSFVPRVHLTRKASDHLPLIVDFEI